MSRDFDYDLVYREHFFFMVMEPALQDARKSLLVLLVREKPELFFLG